MKNYLSKIIILGLVVCSNLSFAADDCIGPDGRNCRVLGRLGNCVFDDNGEVGTLYGQNQICVPNYSADNAAVTTLWYDDPAKLGENLSTPTGKIDDRDCYGRSENLSGQPEIWNRVSLVKSYKDNKFWVSKYILNESGVCALSLLPVIKITPPNYQRGEHFGIIEVSEIAPVMRITKPSASTIYTNTSGFGKVSDLIPGVGYKVKSESGFTVLRIDVKSNRGFRFGARINKPASVQSISYQNFIVRTTEINRYSSEKCLTRDAVSHMLYTVEMFTEMMKAREKQGDRESWFQQSIDKASLPICPGVKEQYLRN